MNIKFWLSFLAGIFLYYIIITFGLTRTSNKNPLEIQNYDNERDFYLIHIIASIASPIVTMIAAGYYCTTI